MGILNSPNNADPQPHILFYISGHGFGHLGQCIPIINQISNAHSNWHVTICSTIPTQHLKSVIKGEFQHFQHAFDFGMLMLNALEVDLEKTEAQFNQQMIDWDKDLESASGLLQECNPTLIINNVSYLIPVAAKSLEIPCISFSSLNWLDITSYYFPENKALIKRLHSSYRDSDYFVDLTPGMSASFCKDWQGHDVKVGPVAQIGQQIQLKALEVSSNRISLDNKNIALVSMGGIPFDLDFSNWPSIDNLVYLTAQTFATSRRDIIPLSELSCSYSDALASCDLLITKPGYGNFVEAAALGIPILYVPRPDWPEQPCLVEWIQENTINQAISVSQFESGDFEAEVQNLINQKYDPIEMNGISELTSLIEDVANTNVHPSNP